MTLYNFFENMTNSYRHKDDRINEAFRTDLNIFCDKIGDSADFQPIYDHVKNEHKSWNTPPMISLFNEAAREAGLFKQFREEVGAPEEEMTKAEKEFLEKQDATND